MVYIDGKWVKKPTKGRCAYCGSDLLEFYDDGTGICLNCGRTFSWLKPLAGPIAPQAQKPRTEGTPHRTQQPAHPSRPKKAPERPPVIDRHTEPPSMPPEPQEGPGFISPKAISIVGFLGGLLLGIGIIVIILAQPMGSWPRYSDSELIGNLRKIGMIIWASGAMLLTMAGFSATGTKEMNYKVRIALVASSVLIAIFFLSLWIAPL